MTQTKPDMQTSRRRLIYGITIGKSAYNFLHGQMAWFSKAGWEVSLATTPDDAAERAAEREGVSLHRVPMTRFLTPVADLASFGKWLAVIARVRPYGVNVSTPKAGLLGGVSAWIFRVPKRIYVVRGLRLEETKPPLVWLLWIMERITTAAATDVVVVSRSLGIEMVRRKLVAPHKVRLIGEGSSNGVDSVAVERRISEVSRVVCRQKLGLGIDSFVVGFIGRITRDKGISTLIAALNQFDPHDDVALLVIGDVEDGDVAAEISHLGCPVVLIPWTDDVWGLLPAIDVLCLPTLREGLPNVVLEAAAAAVPSITTRATGAVDSVIHGQTGLLIDVGDHTTLAIMLKQMIDDPDLVQRLGVKGQEWVRTAFIPENIWKGLNDILEGRALESFEMRAAASASVENFGSGAI